MNNKGFINIVLIIAIVVLVGAVGYFFFIKSSGLSVESPSQTSKESSNSQTVAQNETASWELYNNNVDKISFRFPPDFKKVSDEQRQSKSSAYFTNYSEPLSVSGLPPKGGAHIGFISLPYDKLEFDRYIAGRVSLGDFSKVDATVMGLPATRIEQESPTNSDPNIIQKEITYLLHDEKSMYQFLIEYFKGDPKDAILEANFEMLIKTVDRL